MSKKNQNNIPIISTIIVAAMATILAVAAIIVIINQDGGNESSLTESTASQPDYSYITDEYKEECMEAAYDLLRGSHEILRLFVTEGLPHESEPYGNLPEDGYYTVNSEKYTSMEQIEQLVRCVYVTEAADKVLKNVDGNGLAVYAVDKVLEEAPLPTAEVKATAEAAPPESSHNYITVEKLGISADFTPDASKRWTECAITIDYEKEGECRLLVVLDPKPDSGENSSEILPDGKSALELTMIKTEDGWRLTEFVTRAS